MLVSVFTSWNSKNKRAYSAQSEALLCFTEIIFLSKNVIFLYILKILFIMLHLKIFLEYWRILYIFRISLCVTSPRMPKEIFIVRNWITPQAPQAAVHSHPFFICKYYYTTTSKLKITIIRHQKILAAPGNNKKM